MRGIYVVVLGICYLGAVAVPSVAKLSARGDEPKDKADAEKLVGIWELKGFPNRMTQEYTKDGKFIQIAEGDGPQDVLKAIYTLNGNKLELVWKFPSGDIKHMYTITKLSGEELEYEGKDGKKVSFKKVDAAVKAFDVWKVDDAKDGTRTVSDGTLAVTLPADVTVEQSRGGLSAKIKLKVGPVEKGTLSVKRRKAPPEATKADDPNKWLADQVDKEIAQDKKNVVLVKSSKIEFGKHAGLKVVIDRTLSDGMPPVRNQIDPHTVTERTVYLVGDYLYQMEAVGLGWPGSALFAPDHDFHKTPTAQDFLKSVRLAK